MISGHCTRGHHISSLLAESAYIKWTCRRSSYLYFTFFRSSRQKRSPDIVPMSAELLLLSKSLTYCRMELSWPPTNKICCSCVFRTKMFKSMLILRSAHTDLSESKAMNLLGMCTSEKFAFNKAMSSFLAVRCLTQQSCACEQHDGSVRSKLIIKRMLVFWITTAVFANGSFQLLPKVQPESPCLCDGHVLVMSLGSGNFIELRITVTNI